MTRSAVDTIKGYYYQFDLTVLKLLDSKNPDDNVVIENIEDVDIHTATESTAIQCKYYAKTEYNHSVIAHPIRQMISHFSETNKTNSTPIKYHLYGHYKTGHDKLKLPLDSAYLKKYFLTYKESGHEIEHHKDLKLTDAEIDKFLSLLSIDINAPSYEHQVDAIINLLKREFSCSDIEVHDYYYNNSLRVIKDFSVQPKATNRTISRKDFIKQINKKEDLFSSWYAGYLGREKFFKKIKKDHFTSLNVSAFDRFFLVGINPSEYVRNELKEILHIISKKWSKLSPKEQSPFCPFILISGISEIELIEIKKELFREKFGFVDGHSFLGSDFCVETMFEQANHHNKIKIKIINELNQLDSLLYRSNATKQIFQFYRDEPFYLNNDEDLKHVKIQIHNINEITKII
tara:strand:- start:167848 stop:169056 length:1209 start_codon:yes stop_codon:yes gene_type:complete